MTNNQAILIHYCQYGTNWIAYPFSKKDQEDFINNIIRISSEICKEYNAVDFFVYNVTTLVGILLKKQKLHPGFRLFCQSNFYSK